MKGFQIRKSLIAIIVILPSLNLDLAGFTMTSCIHDHSRLDTGTIERSWPALPASSRTHHAQDLSCIANLGFFFVVGT
jgi:hypothetical protein